LNLKEILELIDKVDNAEIIRDRIAGVVGTGQQHLCFGLFDLAFEPAKYSLEFVEGTLILGGKL